MFKCKFCNKVLKTEKGFQNHMCEKKKRFIEFNEPAYYVWLTVCNIFRIRTPIDDEKKKMSFINDSSYSKIVDFTNWALDIQIINLYDYITFLNHNNVKMNNWKDSHIFNSWLMNYLEKEPTAIAIQRSENYLISNGLKLEEMSSNRLLLAIKYGKISKKYLDYCGFDIKSKLDGSQWNEVDRILTSIEERLNNILGRR